MASFGQQPSVEHEALRRALPRLHKLALVLTANEQLGRALLRGACRASQRDWRRREEDKFFEVGRRMVAIWVAKLAEETGLQGRNPPEPRLFANLPLKGSLAANGHFIRFIANLPSQQRAALYLVYGEGASYDEAAEILSLNMLSLMKLLARGHLALSHWLDHRGLAEGAGREAGMLAVPERAA
jgi:RNA polymerase sigma-70 factor (ECF subfamily)